MRADPHWHSVAANAGFGRHHGPGTVHFGNAGVEKSPTRPPPMAKANSTPAVVMASTGIIMPRVDLPRNVGGGLTNSKTRFASKTSYASSGFGSIGSPHSARMSSRYNSKDALFSSTNQSLSKTARMRKSASSTLHGSMHGSKSSGLQLPKLQKKLNKVKSFEDIYSAARRRAAKRRATERQASGAAFLPAATKSDIAGLLLNQMVLETQDVEEEEPQPEELDEEVLRKMDNLVESAVKAMSVKLLDDIMAKGGDQKKKPAVSPPSDRSPKNSDNVEVPKAKENMPEELAEMLKPPNIPAVLDRLNYEGSSGKEFTAKEMSRMEEKFAHYRQPGSSEIHIDSMYALLGSLGYCSLIEEEIRSIASKVTEYSTLDEEEFLRFMKIFSAWEKKQTREVFNSFDADNSGELSTEEVASVLEALGCSPFKGTLLRLINAVDADKSGTLDFNEFIALFLIYKQTEGFSHEEIRSFHRVFTRFAETDRKTPWQKTVPRRQLPSALVFIFGPQAADLAKRLAKASKRKNFKRQSTLQLKRQEHVEIEEDKDQAGLNFIQFVRWARMMKQQEISAYMKEFKKFDKSGDGVLDMNEIKELLEHMGYTPLRYSVRELVEVVDKDKNGTLDSEEFLGLMEYFKKTDGWTGQQLREMTKAFNKFCDGDGCVECMALMDLIAYLGVKKTMRQTHQLIAKVDVDGSHSLDFPEYLHLMRLIREEELSVFRVIFRKAVSELDEQISDEDLNDLRDYELALSKIHVNSALAMLGFTVSKEKMNYLLMEFAPSEGPDTADFDSIDFDTFVEMADSLLQISLKKSRKQANFTAEEVAAFRQAFETFDSDGSGEIDPDELGQSIGELGLELKTKEDQRRLLTLIDNARVSAAEAGIPEEECGEHGSAVVQWWVFLHLLRILIRQKEEQAFASENEEVKRQHFSNKAVIKLRSLFNYWVSFTQKEDKDKPLLLSSAAADNKEQSEDQAVSATLGSDGLMLFLQHFNESLQEAEKQDIQSKVDKLAGRPPPPKPELEGSNPNIMKKKVEPPPPVELDFVLFVKVIRMLIDEAGYWKYYFNLEAA
mmetsp:Transcript_22610/g.40825  ORF Transcript_22610/g.40825 Transcript_22610/m.40825 type:complete len:1063 (-) Transcript_22610:58-3246(-)